MSNEIVWRDFTEVLPIEEEPGEITVRAICGEIREGESSWYGYRLSIRVDASPEEITMVKKMITMILEERREDRAHV